MVLVKKVNFLNIAPHVRFIHRNSGDDSYRIPKRIIYDHEMIYVIKGACSYWIEGEEYSLSAGDMLLMKPHIEHHCVVPKGKTFLYYAVHFDWLYLGESLDFSPYEVYVDIDYNRLDHIPVQEVLDDRPVIELSEVEFPYVIKLKNPVKCEQHFQEMLEAFENKQHGYQLDLRACMLQILRLLVSDVATEEGVGKGLAHRDTIISVIQYLHRNFQEDLDINLLASSFYFSPNYLRALFKKATGKTILEFVHHIRMEKAKELLLNGEHTITEISDIVGYHNIHYFSNLFKKTEGLSPKNYIESIKNK